MVGTPVIHGGRVPGKALDCVGVPWSACVQAGLVLADTPVYRALPTEEELAEGLRLFCDEVEPTRSDDRGHIWQVMLGREARHVVVPVGVHADGQPLIVHARGQGKRVCKMVLDKGVVRAWNIRGVA